jgi:hypothetical protein
LLGRWSVDAWAVNLLTVQLIASTRPLKGMWIDPHFSETLINYTNLASVP